MRIVLFFSFIIIPLFTHSQLSKNEVSYFSYCLFNKVNQLRTEQNLNKLLPDSNLIKAAKLHSNYMARYNRLSHRESTSKSRTPSLRVKKFSAEFELVGENILFIETKKKKLKNELIEEIAESMFTMWKESPDHYANMIHPQYKLSGFGFARSKSGKLFATQVFGTKGIVINGQLSKNSFGVKPHHKSCDKFLNSKRNFVVNMGNSMRIYDNKAMLFYHSKSLFEEMLPGEKDGIAIDIVSREQFECDSKNLLDFSSIYDGIMLKPIYRSEIFKNNIAESDYRLITQVGTIPEKLLGKNICANLIYIKDGNSCEYAYPVEIPSSYYSLVNVEPKILNPKQYPFINWGIVCSKTIYFNFERGKTSTSGSFEVEKIKGKLKSAEIMGYSSIEGDSATNAILSEGRNSFIKNYLEKQFGQIPFISENSKENWKEMEFQLETLGLDSLKTKRKDKLRALVANDTIHNWDSLLYLQRRSYATISFEGKLNRKDSLFYYQNFQTAISKGNIGLANRALAEMYKKQMGDYYSFSPKEFEVIIDEPQLVQNAAALLSKIYIFETERCVKFLRSWLLNKDKLSNDAKFNLCVLYCKVVSDILDSWDINKKAFVKIVSPDKIEEIINVYVGSPEYSKLLLNYHLTAIKYYGQTNYQKGLETSFNFIANYFKNMALSIEDEIQLCLFFNRWSRYDLTIEYLLPTMKQSGFNEEAAFLLAKTCMAYPSRLTDEEKTKVMNRAFRFNKQRWCEWISEEFQHLRYKAVKETYCKECIK